MFLEQLSLHLKLDNADSLMHLSVKAELFFGETILMGIFGYELSARIVLVGLHCESCEWNKVDAISILECSHIAISQCYPDDIANTSIVSGGSAHPQHIVIAPLNVPAVVAAESVHNDVGSGTTVVDITENMQLVDNQSLNDIAYSNNKVVGAACSDNGLDDGTDVIRLILVVGTLMEQLLNDI